MCKDAFVGSDSGNAVMVIQRTEETKDLADGLFQPPPAQKRIRKKTDEREQQEYWDTLLVELGPKALSKTKTSTSSARVLIKM